MIELLWLGTSLFAAIVTLDNLVDANRARRVWSNGSTPPTPEARAAAAARKVAAFSDLKLQALLLASSAGCVGLVIPSLLRPGDVPLSPVIVVAMAIPLGLAGASVVRRRARIRIERLLSSVASKGGTE